MVCRMNLGIRVHQLRQYRIIGSVGLTVPAAVWLYGQGPTKSGHHHEASHAESEESADAKDEAEPAEDSEDSEESKDDSKDDSKVEKNGDKEEKEEKDDSDNKADSDDSKDESSDDSSDKDSGDDAKAKKDKKEEKEDAGSDSKTTKDSGSNERKYSDDGYELPGPNAPGQINYKPESGKGPGEGQKGPRKPTEKKGEKDASSAVGIIDLDTDNLQAQSSHSGAQNPYLDDDEKSKKGEGLKDTMKIHGTVDSNRPLR